MKKYQFSIVIVTWNALELIRRFLPSVANTEYDNFEIVIADNASTDNTRDWIKENYPQCKVVTYNQNFGYAGGNNRAVKYCTGDIIVFLNNDVRTDEAWLTHLNEAFNDQAVSIVQPKIRSEEEPDRFEYAGAAGGFIDWLGYPFCRGRIFDTVEKDTGQYDDSSDIFWASGAAFAVRKELFEELNGFDENFEFHMEEIDLCWKAWRKGTVIRFEPKSIVYHLGGGSLPMGNPRKVYYNYRNSLIMLTKNLEKHLFAKIFFRLVLDGISGFRSLLQGKPAETLAVIRAHFAFYGRLSESLKKRRQLSESLKSPVPASVIHEKLIISEYFLKKKKTYRDLDR